MENELKPMPPGRLHPGEIYHHRPNPGAAPAPAMYCGIKDKVFCFSLKDQKGGLFYLTAREVSEQIYR